MANDINYEAQSLIQSQSHNSPYVIIFESEDDISVAYAVSPTNNETNIVDQIVFNQPINASDVVLRWNQLGDRAGIIVNERLSLVFDFNHQVTYSDQLVPSVSTTWSRQMPCCFNLRRVARCRPTIRNK